MTSVPGETPILRVSNVEVVYSDVILVLRGVSLEVGTGSIVALLGANGAGKTTLINAIAGLLRPASGSIRFEGHELVGLSPHRIVEMGIATVPENRRLFEPMSVMENLNLGAYVERAR